MITRFNLLRIAFLFPAVTILAHADEITMSFSGAIDFSTSPSIPVGTPYSGTITYEIPNQPIGSASSSGLLVYSLSGLSEGITISAGGYTFSSYANRFTQFDLYYHSNLPELNGDDELEIVNDSGNPLYSATGNLDGIPIDDLGVQIVGAAGLLSSPFLPTSLDLSLLSSARVDSATTGIVIDAESGDGSNQKLILGNISSIQFAVQTPEPGSAGLIGIGSHLLECGSQSRSAGTRVCRVTAEPGVLTLVSWNAPCRTETVCTTVFKLSTPIGPVVAATQ